MGATSFAAGPGFGFPCRNRYHWRDEREGSHAEVIFLNGRCGRERRVGGGGRFHGLQKTTESVQDE